MANKKQKKTRNRNTSKLKKHIIEVILLSLIIFTAIFFIYQIIRLAIKPTDSFIIEHGKIEQKESLIGYVIRDETIIETSENETELIRIKNEGERISVGEAVFRYKAPDEENINSKIAELNSQIQQAMEGQTNQILSSDIRALESQIEEKIDGINNKNNIREIKEYKSDINGYITKKAKIAGELSPAGSYINNLITERTSLEKELKNSSQYKTTSIGGIVSYRVDGLEQVLTPNNFKDVSSEKLESLNLTTGQVVTTSDTACKVINNFECYIVVKTNSNEAKKAETGDQIKILLANNKEIPATIEYIKQEENNNLIILKVTQGVEYLSSYRKISLDLIWWNKEGLKVPNNSIIYENGLSYVIRKKAGVLSKILVKIEKENDKYSIITNYKTEELKNMGFEMQEINRMKKISIYDEILSDPDIEDINKELD